MVQCSLSSLCRLHSPLWGEIYSRLPSQKQPIVPSYTMVCVCVCMCAHVCVARARERLWIQFWLRQLVHIYTFHLTMSVCVCVCMHSHMQTNRGVVQISMCVLRSQGEAGGSRTQLRPARSLIFNLSPINLAELISRCAQTLVTHTHTHI